MTWATLPTPLRLPAAARRPPARPAHAAAERRGAFDLRGGQADDDRVARLHGAVDDLGEAAVADAGADLRRLQLLVGAEEVDGLRLARSALDRAAERARRAGEAAAALAHLGHAALEVGVAAR